MKVTYKSLLEKFIDKGYTVIEFMFIVPFFPIFDPPCWQLQYKSRKELREDYDIRQYPQLEYWNTWIDYQKHK